MTYILLLPFFLIGATIGIYYLVGYLSITLRISTFSVGLFTMIIGALGVIVPLLVLMGNSTVNVQLAVLIAGAIIFGCGAIATAIGKTN